MAACLLAFYHSPQRSCEVSEGADTHEGASATAPLALPVTMPPGKEVKMSEEWDAIKELEREVTDFKKEMMGCFQGLYERLGGIRKVLEEIARDVKKL